MLPGFYKYNFVQSGNDSVLNQQIKANDVNIVNVCF